MKIILLTLLVLLPVFSQAYVEKKIVCYWGSWSVYRPGHGKFDTTNIDPTLCTHLIYTFIGITEDGNVRIRDPQNDLEEDGGKNNFNNFNKLREKSPKTKTMVAIGGWNEDSVNFLSVIAHFSTRQKFIENIIAFIKMYDFDGLDVDWKYPYQQNGAPLSDKQNFVLFLKELKTRFIKEDLILSAAVAAVESSASQFYEISQISNYLDFINLMAYDFHGVWDGQTGLNAPMYPRSSEEGVHAKLNVHAAVQYWLSQGAPAEKLILGIPFYGRGFTLDSHHENSIGAPANKASTAGPYTRKNGIMGYNEMCEKIDLEKWEVVFDKEQRTPYAFKGTQWIGFDNEQTLKEKSYYIKKHGLGGAMVWSIETDDFLGRCGEKYLLLKTLNRELRNGAPSASSSLLKPHPPKKFIPNDIDNEKSQQSSQNFHEPHLQQAKNTASRNEEEICQVDGYVRDPSNCSKFYFCKYLNGIFIQYPLICPTSLVYDTSTSMCDYPKNGQC